VYSILLVQNRDQEVAHIILRRLVDQDAWARQQAGSQGNSSDFWAATGLVLRQFDGLYAGYVMRWPQKAGHTLTPALSANVRCSTHKADHCGSPQCARSMRDELLSSRWTNADPKFESGITGTQRGLRRRLTR